KVNKSQPCEECTAPGLELPKLGAATSSSRRTGLPPALGLALPELGAVGIKGRKC
ncbi:hypothetical protein A2U01_0112242, partial [Trifolium medium]|nr:hypothetical protein [Trifolium medium]